MDAPFACTACALLRQQVRSKVPTSSGGQLVLVPSSSQCQAPRELTEDDIGEQVHSRGRPRKGEVPGSRFNLANFLAVKRKNLYLETDQSRVKGVAKYVCVPCQREIRFVSMTDMGKVLSHEKAERHKRGLERLRRSSEPEQATEPLALQDGDRESCPGVASSDPSMLPHQLEHSIKQYCWAGQPRTVYKDNEKDPMAGAMLEQGLSSVVIRSTKCERVRDSRTSACAACTRQARDKVMLGTLAARAYDIDLVMLAFKSAHGTKDEVEQFKKDIQERDYFVHGWAGNSFKELIKGKAGLQLVQRIRSRFDNTPAWRKSESFKVFLQHYLTSTSMYHDGDTQMEAHNALTSALAMAVQEGRAQAMDLDLAARVAVGQLRTDAIIEGLVTTFLLRSQEALQRPNSSRHLKDVAAMSEALSTLGRRAEINALLQRFGVNPRAVPKMPLDSGLLPKAFGAMGDLAQLKSSIQKAACHLRSVTKRLHVMMDETVWSAAAEQCKGFLEDEGNCDVILQGYWSPQAEDQWHYLDANQWAEAGVPPEKLAKLSLHFVVTRPDNPRFCLDTCMLPRAPRQRTSADEMLELCGTYLESATSVAGGPAMYKVA